MAALFPGVPAAAIAGAAVLNSPSGIQVQVAAGVRDAASYSCAAASENFGRVLHFLEPAPQPAPKRIFIPGLY